MEQYPSGRYADTTKQLQEALISEGFLAPLKENGESSADGWFGEKTKEALIRKLHQPPAPKHFLQSRRGKGIVKMGVGLGVGLLGLVWSGAESIDSEALVDVGFRFMEYWPAFAELIGLMIAALGFGQHAKGSINATAPIVFHRVQMQPNDEARRSSATSFWDNQNRGSFLNTGN